MTTPANADDPRPLDGLDAVADQVRAWADASAADLGLPAADTPAGAVAPVLALDRRRTARRRLAVLSAAAAVVLLVGGGIAFAGGGSSGGRPDTKVAGVPGVQTASTDGEAVTLPLPKPTVTTIDPTTTTTDPPPTTSEAVDDPAATTAPVGTNDAPSTPTSPPDTSTPPNPTVPPVGDDGVPPPEPEVPIVDVTVELPTHQVASGGTITGTLVVVNPSSSPVEVGYCSSMFFGVLRNDTIENPGATTQCLRMDSIAPGRSEFPITLRASYSSCTNAAQASASVPACGPGGSIPGLPAGSYQVKVYAPSTSASGFADSLPMRVATATVTVTA
jgi:hypothetical protein